MLFAKPARDIGENRAVLSGWFLKKGLAGYKPITGFSGIAEYSFPVDGLPCLAGNHFLQKNIEGGQGTEADGSNAAESP